MSGRTKSINKVAVTSPNLRELTKTNLTPLFGLVRGYPAFRQKHHPRCFPNSYSLTAHSLPHPLGYLAMCERDRRSVGDNIAERCPNLLELNLSSCKAITDKGLRSLMKKCRTIQSLNLYRCIHLTDDVIVQIEIHCRNLKNYLRNCNISNFSIIQLIKHCHEITELDHHLSSSDKLTDQIITQISVGLPFLEILYLEDFTLLTENSMLSDLSSCPLIHTETRLLYQTH